MRNVLVGLFVSVLVGCSSNAPANTAQPLNEADYIFPAAPRIVAIGDLHGDLEVTRRVLRLAGAIDEQDAWVGGHLVVVQTGDQLDRGSDEQEILALLDRLRGEADRAGGALHVLNGNHEIMNVLLDFRYATPAGLVDFDDVTAADLREALTLGVKKRQRIRAAAFHPGGPYAEKLATRNEVAIVGDNVFVHGGIRPEHVAYGLAKMNDDIRQWMRGNADEPEVLTSGDDSPVWTRAYSDPEKAADCAALSAALQSLGAKRMVVGHTIQETGITSACSGKVIRIDVGLSRAFGGPTQALEIVGDNLSVIE